MSSTQAGLHADSWDLRWLVKCPEFTQAGREVKEPFVRLHLTSGSWVKGHFMLILLPSSETWSTQPSTASLGLPGQTDDVQVPLSQARTPVTPSKASLDPRRPCYPEALLRRKGRQAPLLVGLCEEGQRKEEKPQSIHTLGYTMCTQQPEGRTGRGSILKLL